MEKSNRFEGMDKLMDYVKSSLLLVIFLILLFASVDVYNVSMEISPLLGLLIIPPILWLWGKILAD